MPLYPIDPGFMTGKHCLKFHRPKIVICMEHFFLNLNQFGLRLGFDLLYPPQTDVCILRSRRYDNCVVINFQHVKSPNPVFVSNQSMRSVIVLTNEYMYFVVIQCTK